MFTHLFRLIWNKKKQNALLITEMFFSFIVMFAIFTVAVYCYKSYRQPMGFEYKDVWAVSFTPPENITDHDSVAIFHEALNNTLRSMPQITEFSFCGNNIPFSMNTSNTSVSHGKHKKVMAHVYKAGEDYLKVLNVKMKSGRWFTKADAFSKTRIVVINRKLENELFDGQDAVGKKLGDDYPEPGKPDVSLHIIGVVEDTKDKGLYEGVQSGMYQPIDTSSARYTGTMLLKVKPGTDAAFESKLFKTLSNTIGTNIEIEHLDKKLITKNKFMVVPMIIAGVVAGFLIINVALGLFGVLWYNINKRKGEIGLRRAIGASGVSVSRQLVGEALILSTISLILGLFFAVQFPLLNVFDFATDTYIVAMVLAVLFIYLLVTFCALYPGKQAAAIYPAVALHED